MAVYDDLRKIPAYWITLFAVILVIIIGILDYLTGVELNLDIFLLIPIFLVAWFVGRLAGAGLAAFSAVIWSFANFNDRAIFSSPFIFDVNVAERLALFLIIVLLISALRRAFDRTDELSRTDSLTNLLNVRAFYIEATNELERAQRFARPFALAYIDVDDFKQINDTHGHLAGDESLRVVASVIKRNIRTIDVAGRLGGDEFAILLSETGETQAREVLARLVSELGEAMDENGYTNTLSIGVVVVSEFPTSIEEVIKRADDAMYAVKKSGKNAVSFKIQR